MRAVSFAIKRDDRTAQHPKEQREGHLDYQAKGKDDRLIEKGNEYRVYLFTKERNIKYIYLQRRDTLSVLVYKREAKNISFYK